EIAAIVRAADSHGAWILADEVYRGAEREGPESPSFSGRGDRVVVTGGLSKVYGLPALRIGWLVGRRELVAAALELKADTMIVPGAHFRAERHLRIGFGMPPRILHAGLAAVDRLLASLD